MAINAKTQPCQPRWDIRSGVIRAPKTSSAANFVSSELLPRPGALVAPVDPLHNGSGLWPERVIINAGLAGRAAARVALERTPRLGALVADATDVYRAGPAVVRGWVHR